MLLGQRDVEAIVGSGGLQFKIEGTAEALAQGESPSAVDPRSEGRMNDELHAARFIEEALGDDGALVGHRPKSNQSGFNVLCGLLRAAPIQSALAHQERNGL